MEVLQHKVQLKEADKLVLKLISKTFMGFLTAVAFFLVLLNIYMVLKYFS